MNHKWTWLTMNANHPSLIMHWESAESAGYDRGLPYEVFNHVGSTVSNIVLSHTQIKKAWYRRPRFFSIHRWLRMLQRHCNGMNGAECRDRHVDGLENLEICVYIYIYIYHVQWANIALKLCSMIYIDIYVKYAYVNIYIYKHKCLLSKNRYMCIYICVCVWIETYI